MITLSERRQHILDEMAKLDRLQRGYLSKQFFTRKQGGKTIRYGPYYLLQHIFKGNKKSQRIALQEVADVQLQISAWKRFEALAQEFVEVTEEMTLESKVDDDSKKNGRRLNKRDVRKPKSSSV